MNPALPEGRERRTLNNSAGLCTEPASCGPLPQVQDGSGSRPGAVGGSSVESKLGGNRCERKGSPWRPFLVVVAGERLGCGWAVV